MPTSPGVYVEEVSTFPPSIAEVSTAVPAFLGYTEIGPALTPTRITTMREFEELFGGPPKSVEQVSVGPGEQIQLTLVDKGPLLYYSLRLYFDNGGGPAYIVSLGGHDDPPALTHLQKGLEILEKEDEPTLIVMSDATRLSAADLGQAGIAALSHCGKMRDRFAILDLQDGQDAGAFRTNLSSDKLAYGAAYAPHIRTALPMAYREAQVRVAGVSTPNAVGTTGSAPDSDFSGTVAGLKITYRGSSSATPKAKILTSQTGQSKPVEFSTDPNGGPTLTVSLKAGSSNKTTVESAWNEFADKGGFELTVTGTNVNGAGDVTLTAVPAPASGPSSLTTVTLDSLSRSNTALHNQIKAVLGRQRVTLPPSGAIAGIYARVDRDRGVWKAPANVAVASAIELTQSYTDEEQGRLNVDPTSGKSINALRTFVGRGTLVWGARTLAGNDNEWRYISVRRLFIMIEESAQKSTAFAVFEPNTAETWLKVKAMIESYLYGLWERGALAGSKPEAAYFVNVGLGTTMTPQDILEGRMIVEVGIAAVRPAEFIILRFSHKLQEA